MLRLCSQRRPDRDATNDNQEDNMTRPLTWMFVAAMTAAVVFCSGGASAQDRFALVIGNSNYQAVRQLPNAVHDAAAVGDFLKSAGFEVTTALDLDQAGMRRAVQDFAQRVAGKDDQKTTALLYFAGHGVQVDGENYLVPVDAKITGASDIPLAAVRFADIMNMLEEIGDKTRIIFLDACRDNPFGDAAAPHGLAIVTAPADSLVVYSTSPGATAEDGSGANSPFTEALLSAGKKPGESIEETIKNMRVAVNAETVGRQIPWDVSSLVEPFSFFPAPGPSSASAGTQTAAAASDRSAKSSGNLSADNQSAASTSAQTAGAPSEPSATLWRDKLKGLSAEEAHRIALREDRVVVYQVVLDLFPHAPFAAELRGIVSRRVEMWAWVDAVNLNSVAGYQAFLKLYPNNDDLHASAHRLGGRIGTASGNEAPDALGLDASRTKTVVRVATADCGGGGGVVPRPRPVPITVPHVQIEMRPVRPTVRPPSISVGRVR
jgi:uncharacterized caspase-like protein